MATTLGALNPLRYRGYVYDGETGWYYLQSRYYDPEVGRFISADVYLSTGQGVLGCNCYCYCGNNPVNASDRTGYKDTGLSAFLQKIKRVKIEIVINDDGTTTQKVTYPTVRDDVIDCAIGIMNQNTGRKYKLGEWDCSTYVNLVFNAIWGRRITTGGTNNIWDQGKNMGWEHGRLSSPDDLSRLKKADLIFMFNKGHGKNHIMIYFGNGLVIDNASGTDVSIRPFSDISTKGYSCYWMSPGYEE